MKDFSLQLYSLRDVPSLRERMKIAAKAGYTGVEFAGYEDYSAAELKALLEDNGLRATGTHVPVESLRADLDGCISYCREAGIQTAACPWMDLKTAEDAKEAAVFLENCANRFEAAGIPFAYHNHAHEFAPAGGGTLYDILVENTQKTGFELDVYWAAYAGRDPIALLHRYAGRFPLLHFKELGADKKNVELGSGVIDFPALASIGFAQGTRELVVEQEDYTMPPAESVRADALYMQKLAV